MRKNITTLLFIITLSLTFSSFTIVSAYNANILDERITDESNDNINTRALSCGTCRKTLSIRTFNPMYEYDTCTTHQSCIITNVYEYTVYFCNTAGCSNTAITNKRLISSIHRSAE